MRDVKARKDALLFHRGHVSFGNGALGAFFDEGLQFGLVLSETLGKRMFGSDCHEGHAHDGVGARRVDLQKLLFAVDFIREAEVDADRLADPVFLHAAHLFGPAVELLKVFEQFFGVLRDAEVVTRDFALFNESAGTPAAAVDDLFVGQNRLVDRVPIHDLGLAVADAAFEHLQEHPLIPAVVLGLAGGHFARPVESQAEREHLLLHVGDVAVGPFGRSHFLGQSGVFCGQTEAVPAHRRHYVVALHAAIAVKHVVEGVVADMAHVQLAGGVGQHGAHIELGLFLAVRTEGVFDGAVDIVLSPLFLDLRFDFLRIVGFAHGAPFVVVFEGKIRPTSIRPFAPCLRVGKSITARFRSEFRGHRRLRIIRVLGWLSGYNRRSLFLFAYGVPTLPEERATRGVSRF